MCQISLWSHQSYASGLPLEWQNGILTKNEKAIYDMIKDLLSKEGMLPLTGYVATREAVGAEEVMWSFTGANFHIAEVFPPYVKLILCCLIFRVCGCACVRVCMYVFCPNR